MAMENVLKCLVRDSQALGRGFLHIKQQSQVALELLESQTGLMQSTPHELREKCFASLHSALLSNSGHLLKLGLLGVQKLLRDNHFVSKHCDPPDDRQWLLSQLLECLSFPGWAKVSEEVQIETTKIFISFACLESKYLNLNAHVVVDLLTRLLDMGQSGGVRSRKHQVALQTAAVQNMQTFAKYMANVNPQPVDCDVNQTIPIIQFLCDKLEDGLATSQAFPVEFSLESIEALLSNLPDDVVLNSRSHSFVWRTLCPTLLKLVGLPCPNAPATSDSKISELRCVASIGCELLRLFGNVSVLRAPLESLFHRLLVTDHFATRIEIFKIIKQVFSKSQRLLVIAGPFLVEGNEETHPEPDELGLLRVLFDGMEESVRTEHVELRTIVLSCANTLQTSLLSLTQSPSAAQIPDAFAEKINLLYDDLESCDYMGPLSCPTRLRLPKTYEQLVKDQNSHMKPPTITIDLCRLMEEEEEEEEEDDCSTTSGMTEGPEFVDKEEESGIQLFGDGYATRSNHVDLERLAARKFLEDLETFIASLAAWRSPLEVDLALQQFASEYCEDNRQVIFNADGIYLATYATLLLNFELAKGDFYPSRTGFVAQSEDDFIGSVLNSGILVYLTSEFLAELYQGVLVSDVMGNAGFDANADSNAPMSTCAFVNLLTDVRQVKCPEQATCFLSDCRKLHLAFTPNFLLRDPRRQAGLKFARRLVTCFWDSFLFIYSSGVSPTPGDLAVSQALECLENAAKLANILGLQDRSGTIFSLLACVACGSRQLSAQQQLPRHKSLKNRLTKARLAGLVSKPVLDIDLPHILSLDVVLNKGLELASYNKEAWTHVLRCCLYVTELERRVYQSRQTDKFKVATRLKRYTSKLKWKLSESGAKDGTEDDLRLSSAAFGGLDDDSSSTDSYSFLTAASQLPNNDNDVQQLLEKAMKSDSYRSGGRLDDTTLARIVGVLSQRVDLLMEDAAAKLNLKSLLLLIEELCQLCHVQLGHLGEDNIAVQCHWVLHRIGEVMLRSVKTGRPLYHALHCWAIVGPTLLKAACSSDPTIAKTSVEILRSVISHVLQEQPEPRHFHFNEALFKPLEHILCRENVDCDLQDQVMSSLCELVECWSAEIRSGWRPLFACLRRWPPPPQGPVDTCSSSRRIHCENVSTVKEILAAFVQHGAASNQLIFANAAMDAILCQLHYLKCHRYVAELSDTALDCLEKFSRLLAQMLCAPSTPVFYSATSLTFLANECDFEALAALASEHRHQMEAETQGSWSVLFDPASRTGPPVHLWDNSTAIYKVFYLLVDGIACCLTYAKDPVQKSIGELVVSILILLVDIREYEFALLCLRCSILPGMSHWLANLLLANAPQTSATFKQMCGLLCEVVTRLAAATRIDQDVFRQVTLLYVHCAVQDDESLVRIGNSCLRHLLLHCAQHLHSQLWPVAASALCLVVRCNLGAAQRLIQSDRVAEQLSRQHSFRLEHLSQQIFNQPVAETLSPLASCNLFVALLSYQLAINTIANIVCCSNEILTGREKILDEAVFAENMQLCAQVSAETLATLSGALRNGCEFGIDFEMALGMRRHLQKLYGFAQLPSLSQVTALTSDLLVVSLANLAAPGGCDHHMRELEQWLDFLIDFYLQESGNEPSADPPASSPGQEENPNDDADPPRPLDDSWSSPDDCPLEDEEQLTKQQMAAALESYRRQKKLQTSIVYTRPKSPTMVKTKEMISRSMLLTAIRLLSQLEPSVQSRFQITWNIMSRVSLHCTDPQVRNAHEQFEKVFPLHQVDPCPLTTSNLN